jgi:rhodanese-related sulfurtransferase
MSEILDFLLQHWQLSATFVALVIAYIIFEIKQDPGQMEVSAEQAISLYNHEHAVIIDIRSKESYEGGHIVGAISMTAEHLQNNKKLQKYAQKPLIIVCNSGRTSLIAVKSLHKEGFNRALSLAGGMNAWQAAGLPLTTAASKAEL